MSIERELKVLADAVAAVPDLCGAVDGLIVGEPVQLELKAVYYDTPDLSMIRSGVTLRSRTGEPGPTWTLKLPTGSQKGGLSRHEINFDAKLGKVPAAALDAVTAYVRRSKLGPVADIQTKRTATNLLLGDVIVATICDDHVEGRFGGTGVSQFREIEVELINPIPDVDLLKAIRALFREAGWKVEVRPRPKLNRVLGDAISKHPLLPVSSVGRKATAQVALQALIAKSVCELISFDAGTRLDLDIEDLHRFRVAARRMRSDLRTFRGAFERSWVDSLRAELRWVGERAGSVRDLDVLADRLAKAVQMLDDTDAKAAELLMSTLREQRAAARNELLDALKSPSVP